MDEEQTPTAPSTPTPAPAPVAAPPPPPVADTGAAGFSVAALVLGIVGLVLTFTFILGLICDVLAVIFGALGRTRASDRSQSSLSTAGLVLGLVGLGILLLAVVLFRAGVIHAHVFFVHRRMMFQRG